MISVANFLKLLASLTALRSNFEYSGMVIHSVLKIEASLARKATSKQKDKLAVGSLTALLANF
jgi:hypothetical protein